ncbi:12330_t:CDS:2 [Racocetra fulgida]|uniref:12330_t:CDS:1 n=1 Tax=Racocetra fulgida TaxID=60492 RepID=A0A9N8YZE1_9GLOM|nr:12330_t:CDS:2 [Racocetra fulgida]
MDDSNDEIPPKKSIQKTDQITNKKLKKKRTYTSLKHDAQKKKNLYTSLKCDDNKEKTKLDDTIGKEKVPEWTTPITKFHQEKAPKKPIK